jgi:UDP-N-acetylmuramoyl-L-alanyl-D-glutamate--2,6-diaminopimelate ligase
MPTMPTLLDDTAAAARWLRLRLGGSAGAAGASIGDLCSDSRSIRRGDAFVAWPGLAHDARRFVPDALAAGAAACLVEADRVGAFGFADARIAAVPQLKRRAGPIAAEFYGRPSEGLTVVATTGTNGKTSTAWWLAQALGRLGRRCAAIGTLGIGEPPRAAGGPSAAFQATGLTTPDAVMLQRALHDLVGRGFGAIAIEASSIGLAEHRLDGLAVDVALFTNLTQDHLDYHGTMAEYWAAKRRLFGWPGLKATVINVDDAHGAALAEELRVSGADLWTCALQRDARLRGGALRVEGGGLAFEIEAGQVRLPVRTRLLGAFNASNLLLVIGALRALHVPLEEAVHAAAMATPVPGRMQRVASGAADEPEVVVDYAHSPDALDQVLHALRPFARARGGRLWCVFGCGGNRDATKRPLMGAIAARQAERVVLTSDNPRHEAPDFILAQILAGVAGHDEVDVIEDRREAIAYAVGAAAPADVVLIAGKGHEDYQEVAGVRRPFSDVAEALAALRVRAAEAAC